ncbi:MAG: TSUP family transporter [Chloroflexi bacterium]|nr:TSUP family transporter [Chloroflexota bacterium]
MIMPDQAVALLILGVVAGVLSGMFGIGGGVVIVPILVALFSFELRHAIATSLGALMMPVAILAVIAYYRAGLLSVRISALVAAGLIVGGIVGAQIQSLLSIGNLQLLYGFFLLYAAWRFIEPRRLLRLVGPAVVQDPVKDAPWYLLLLVGFGAGIISAMFGVGGGIVIVPVLVGLLHFDQKLAVGTSLGALLPPTTIGSVINYYQQGLLSIPTSALVAVGLLFGALAGARLAISLPSATVKRLYGVFLLVIALRFILTH